MSFVLNWHVQKLCDETNECAILYIGQYHQYCINNKPCYDLSTFKTTLNKNENIEHMTEISDLYQN